MAVGTGVDSSMVVLTNTINAFVQKYIEPTIFDQVLKHNPVLYRFWRKGPVLDGGASLIWPILSNTKTYGGWYTGAGQLPHGVEDTIQPAEVLWRHVAEDVTIPRTDLLKARTPYAKVNLIKTKMDEALLNVRSRVSTALYTADATALSLDNLLQAIDDGGVTTSYAGISHTATNSAGAFFWKPGLNQDGVLSTATPVTMTVLQDMYGRACDGDLQPTLMVTTQTGFNYIWGQLQAQQRYVQDDEMTKAGFEALRFNRAALVVDRNCPSGTVLFLNEEWVDLVSHEEENWAIDPIIPGTPSERTINTKIVWSGNLRVKTPRYCSKIINATNV
jgi:hypothetical protein